MRYVRLTHPRHWVENENSFASSAFKRSSQERGAGASIIDYDCAIDASASICAHIGRHYADTAGEPVVFFLFEGTDLPPSRRIVQKDGPGNDKCHHEVLDVTDGALRKKLRSLQTGAFMICEDGQTRALAPADFPALVAAKNSYAALRRGTPPPDA